MCMSTSTQKTSGVLFDPGGPLRNYPDNTTCSLLINPPCAQSITLVFDSFSLEDTYDFLYVYDGTDKTGKLLFSATGYKLPPTVTPELPIFSPVDKLEYGPITKPEFVLKFMLSLKNIPLSPAPTNPL